MSDFKTISTQEELDAVLKPRLDRKEEKVREEFKDYTSPSDLAKIKEEFEKKIADLSSSYAEKDKAYADFDKTKSELEAKIATYESNSVKMKVAHETGLPYEMVDRLKGSSEEEIKKDAESLVKLIGNQNKVPPLANHDSKPGDTTLEAYRKMAKSLKGD